MVAFAVLVDIFEYLFLAADGGGHLESFQDADAVVPPAAQIVSLAQSWGFPEFLDEAGDIVGVDIVADLLSLVAEDSVEASLDVAADQVAQKTVQLDAAVVGTGQAAATQAAGLHT